MTVFVRVRRLARVAAGAALGLGLALGAAACGGDGESDTAATSSPAPVLGQNNDRIQLTEGAAFSLGSEDERTTSLQITGYEDGDEPSVVISVREGEGEAASHTLRLGDTLDIAGEAWQVSEIGVGESASMPGSATLTRAE
ncbi:DUF6406 domain-containing protein [Marinitenerispora sediminis]|uniref:DUF5666 domain-containing protein n=1 Tax=Marinitenerispora sediminis TaxID=1931232 RepID=A0A368T1S8_9ACTN|nr:DUF6406 domain-containing protein [Marinitenerispora sediminis]RCV50175.1 hypothetical protein DEF23_22475 [Marinitenerispora sediminis]RCV54528.1 hypothetical protein DEF24_19140 [Marinitenerispora sediminis]RCV56957.1 hypothetical protein DEF28_02450 [Marinitenerispora sediminis]